MLTAEEGNSCDSAASAGVDLPPDERSARYSVGMNGPIP